MRAAAGAQVGVMECLLAHGADIHARDKVRAMLMLCEWLQSHSVYWLVVLVVWLHGADAQCSEWAL